MDASGIFQFPELWRLVAEASFDGIMFVDPDRRVLFWNCQAARITGFTADEVVGESCLVGIRCPNCLRRCGLFTKGEICERTVPLITKSGREILVVKNALLVKDSKGEVLGGIETFHRHGAAVPAGDGIPDERDRIREALAANRWGRDLTAKALGMSRATLWRKMKRLGL